MELQIACALSMIFPHKFFIHVYSPDLTELDGGNLCRSLLVMISFLVVLDGLVYLEGLH